MDTAQNDHDLLIELRTDVRTLLEAVRGIQPTLSAMNQRQSDLESRMTNLSATVQRGLADQNDDRRAMEAIEARLTKDTDALGTQIRDVKGDIDRWKLYGKVAAALLTPIYLMLLYAAEQALRAWLFP